MADRIFEAFSAPNSPEVGHYSHGIYPVVPGVPVTLAGIVGKEVKIDEQQDITTAKLVRGGTGAETKRILEEIKRQLEAISLSVKHVMHVRIMLAGPVRTTDEPSEDFATMNKAYREVFKDNTPPPTRDTVGGCELLDGARVEMVATAWKPTFTAHKSPS